MKDVKSLEKVYKVLANKRRIAILAFLKNRDKTSVGDIASEIKISFKATSKHLLILLNADFVEREQINTQMLYRIAKTKHSTLVHFLSIL